MAPRMYDPGPGVARPRMLVGEARAPDIVMAPQYWLARGKRISDRVAWSCAQRLTWHNLGICTVSAIGALPVAHPCYRQVVARDSWAQCGHRHNR